MIILPFRMHTTTNKIWLFRIYKYEHTFFIYLMSVNHLDSFGFFLPLLIALRCDSLRRALGESWKNQNTFVLCTARGHSNMKCNFAMCLLPCSFFKREIRFFWMQRMCLVINFSEIYDKNDFLKVFCWIVISLQHCPKVSAKSFFIEI